jgi:TetR/AcrR family transcriptional repressor of nem operon
MFAPVNQRHDRSQVLAEGLQLFWSKGYASLGVDEICAATGMAKGAFYHAFKSKENFLVAALEAFGTQTVKHITSELKPAKGKAIDRIRHMYASMFRAQPKKGYAGCLVNNTMSELGDKNSAACDATAREFNRILDAIEPTVKEAQADGDLFAHVDPRRMTELLHTTFFGALTRMKTTKDHKQGMATMDLLINTLKPTQQ